jgi:hypothetical protein
MRRTLSILVAGAMAATSAAASFAPAQAAMPRVAPVQVQDEGVVQVENNRSSQWWYNQRRHGGGGNGWHNGGRGWDNGGRHGWDNNNGWNGGRHYYRRHRDWDDNNGAGLALGLFGFAAGAVVGSQLQGGQGYGYGGGYDAHDAACAQRFRSYDPNSNTYLGYDGYRHYC